jgi:hypothetical protein
MEKSATIMNYDLGGESIEELEDGFAGKFKFSCALD